MVRMIAQLIRPYRWFLLVVLATMLVQAGVGLAAPVPLKLILDNIAANHPTPEWVNWVLPMLPGGSVKMRVAALSAIIVVLVAVLIASTSYFTTYVTTSVGQWVANDLRIRTYHHLQRLSLTFYHSHQVGNILSTITDDVSTVQLFASQSTIGMLVDILTIGGMIVVMFLLRIDFALIAVAVVPFLVFFVSRVRGAIQKATQEVRKRQADILATAQEGLESVEAVEAYEREDLEERQLAEISRGAVQAALKARRVRALLSPIVTIPIALCTAFVLWRGSSLIVAGAMTAGTLSIFSAYLARFFGPVQDLSGQADTIAQTAVAVQRIRAILDADTMISERPNAIDPPPFRGQIAFEDVAFSYDRESPVLRDITFSVEPGQMLGIVGATGSGKSTIVSLIPRFYEANAGTITIDGADIRGYKLHGLRSQIGFVLQETIMFRGTIRDNVAFGRPDATLDEVVQAAKLANADEFITRMPHGYDSIVGERGMTLSGGQRQRIGIARALIRDDPILILDEPTASLDAQSEDLVIEALERLMKGRTVLCIAHRLSTIRDAAKIVAIKDGVVAEQGTHHYDHVVATKDFHVDPGSHFSDKPDYAQSWPPHCVAGTPGADFPPGLETSRIEAVFAKGAYSAAYSGFEGTDETGTSLSDWLRRRGVDQVDIVGIATDYCVQATAVDAVRAGLDTRVLVDLTAGVAPESSANALDGLRGIGVELVRAAA